MSKPMIHARKSSEKFGGSPSDYIEIHQMMDESKGHVADARHRCIFHSSYGCFIIEDIFGFEITNSEGKNVSVRDIAEQHILDDLGFIPSLEKYLSSMKLELWMSLGIRIEEECRNNIKEECINNIENKIGKIKR